MILSDICEVYSGYALKKFNDSQDGNPVIKIGNILTDGTLGLNECQYTLESVNSKYYSKKGDIYIALSGATTGKIGIMNLDVKHIINQRVGIVRKKDDSVPVDFVKYFLLGQTQRILKEAFGCAQPNISPKQISQYIVPSLSKEMMEEIVLILNKLSYMITMRKRELTALDELIKARFVEMFGIYPINEKGWEIGTIRDVITEAKYGSSRPAVVGGQYPYLRMNNITYSGELDLTDTKEIDIPENELPKCTVRRGDVLFNRTNSKELVGKTCVYNRDELMVLAGFVIRVRVNERMLPEFLSAFLNTDFSKQMLLGMCKAAIGQANINAQEMQNIRLYIPPIELQEGFVAFKSQVDKSKVVVQKALDEAQLLFDSLMQKYFG